MRRLVSVLFLPSIVMHLDTQINILDAELQTYSLGKLHLQIVYFFVHMTTRMVSYKGLLATGFFSKWKISWNSLGRGWRVHKYLLRKIDYDTFINHTYLLRFINHFVREIIHRKLSLLPLCNSQQFSLHISIYYCLNSYWSKCFLHVTWLVWV